MMHLKTRQASNRRDGIQVLNRLILLRILRPECVLSAVRAFITAHLGADFAAPQCSADHQREGGTQSFSFLQSCARALHQSGSKMALLPFCVAFHAWMIRRDAPYLPVNGFGTKPKIKVAVFSIHQPQKYIRFRIIELSRISESRSSGRKYFNHALVGSSGFFHRFIEGNYYVVDIFRCACCMIKACIFNIDTTELLQNFFLA